MNFEEISSKVKEIGKDTIKEVQRLNEVRILNGKISDANKQINSLYAEMGKKLFEQYKEEALEGYEAEINSINEYFAQIDEFKLQVRGLKGVVVCPCCSMEVPGAEKFCSNCGAKMPETEPEAADFEEEFEETVEAEAEDIVEEAAAEEFEAAAEEVVAEAAEAAEEFEAAVKAAVSEKVEEASEAVVEAVEEAFEETEEEKAE